MQFVHNANGTVDVLSSGGVLIPAHIVHEAATGANSTFERMKRLHDLVEDRSGISISMNDALNIVNQYSQCSAANRHEEHEAKLVDNADKITSDMYNLASHTWATLSINEDHQLSEGSRERMEENGARLATVLLEKASRVFLYSFAEQILDRAIHAEDF